MANTDAYPYSAIAFITVDIGGVGYEGSGLLLSPDEVLTAAHVVYTSGIGTAVNIQVSPGYNNGSAPFGTISGNVTHYNAISDAGDSISLASSQSDFAVIHLTTPVSRNVGAFSLGADFMSGAVTVSGYPGYSGNQFDVTENVSTVQGYNLLTGTALGPGSSGGPVWTAGGTVVGTVSSGSTTTSAGYFTKITSADRALIQSWVAQDEAAAATPPVLGYSDASTGAQGGTSLTASGSGGPSYLQYQYIWSGSDSVALATSAPNVFIRGGPGEDSIQVTSGENVLDGGTGSNYLTGGTGTDTFFTDARGSSVVWNTLNNFHVADAATLWGFMPGVSSYHWDTSVSGSPGATGATLRANIVGGNGRTGDGIDASITFAGLSIAQAQKLQVSTGTQAAGSYLYFYNPGV